MGGPEAGARAAEVLGETSSLCKVCLGHAPAVVLERAGRVLLEKRCPRHGLQLELLEEDASWYRRRLEFDKPGTDSLRQTAVDRGCPFDCGLCPAHEQHTCIAPTACGWHATSGCSTRWPRWGPGSRSTCSSTGSRPVPPRRSGGATCWSRSSPPSRGWPSGACPSPWS